MPSVLHRMINILHNCHNIYIIPRTYTHFPNHKRLDFVCHIQSNMLSNHKQYNIFLFRHIRLNSLLFPTDIQSHLLMEHIHQHRFHFRIFDRLDSLRNMLFFQYMCRYNLSCLVLRSSLLGKNSA